MQALCGAFSRGLALRPKVRAAPRRNALCNGSRWCHRRREPGPRARPIRPMHSTASLALNCDAIVPSAPRALELTLCPPTRRIPTPQACKPVAAAHASLASKANGIAAARRRVAAKHC